MFALNCNEEILRIENLAVSRSGSRVINNIDMSVSCGEFVGIVGPNGAGKTTLLLTILGILKPREGSIKIYEKKPNDRAIVGKVGWVPQTASKIPTNVHITVKEFIQLGTLSRKSFFQIRKQEREKVAKIIDIVGLNEYANRKITNFSK